jgi:hypothetical protein
MAALFGCGYQEIVRFSKSQIATEVPLKSTLPALSGCATNKFVGKSYLGVYSHLC